jgi:hypothetical protein
MFSRRVTESFNWRYASGEILLIFVGVMLALAASDWYEKRLAHQIEVEILSEIGGSLRRDLGLIKSLQERYVLLEEKVSDLHEHIRERPPYSPDLDAKFGALYGFSSASIDTAAYQTLKSESLLLISDPKLRSAITQVYERAYGSMLRSMDVEIDMTRNVLRPFYIEKFHNVQFSRTATPIDYESLIDNPVFSTLLMMRLSQLRFVHIENSAHTISGVEETIAAIDDFLAQ